MFVDGETAIPETDDYEAKITYAPHVGHAMAAMSMGPYRLGHILSDRGRGGATAYIGFLSTQARRTQRVFIINNGSRDVSYTFSFTTESGVVATARDMATGTVMAGEVKMLPATQIVSFSGDVSLGSAMIIFDGSAEDIEVTSNLVTPSVGVTIPTEHMVMDVGTTRNF